MRLFVPQRPCPAATRVLRDGASKPARLFAIALLLGTAVSMTAQTPRNFTRIYGSSDRDIPTPAHTAKTASDAAALEKLIGFVKASGVTGWKGMTADGTITYAGDATPYPAHVTVLGGNCFRLDVKKDAGTASTVFNGAQGVFLPSQGSRSSLSPDVSTLGLLAFARLLSPDYPQPASIVTDGGPVSVNGQSLYRITLDDPATVAGGASWNTQDLYFESSTGRLAQSAAFVHLSTADRALYMLENTYGDYRAAGTGVLPHTITQSMNGALQWTLTLTNIDLAAIPDPSLFQF